MNYPGGFNLSITILFNLDSFKTMRVSSFLDVRGNMIFKIKNVATFKKTVLRSSSAHYICDESYRLAF